MRRPRIDRYRWFSFLNGILQSVHDSNVANLLSDALLLPDVLLTCGLADHPRRNVLYDFAWQLAFLVQSEWRVKGRNPVEIAALPKVWELAQVIYDLGKEYPAERPRVVYYVPAQRVHPKGDARLGR